GPTPSALGDAAELLIQRIRQVQPDFERSDENARSIERIVMLTDGLPLAIELAAARVRLLGVDALADRLSDQLRVLSSRSAERPSRQRTLRATLDWSWDLLDGYERACLAQLSVFEGVFTVEAAEQVVQFDGDEAPWVDDVLMGLVEKSLVVCRVPAGERAPRLTLLRTVKQYGAEKLGPNSAATLGRHGSFYCRLGLHEPSDTLDVHGGEEQRQEWTLCLADVLAATRRAIQAGDGLLAGAGARASWAILCIKGPFSLGVQLLKDAIQVPSCTSQGVRLDLGRAMWRDGKLEEASHVLQQVLVSARAEQDAALSASAGAVLGGLLWATGKNAESRIVLDEAAEIAEASGLRRRLGVIEGNRMVLCVMEGDPGAAVEVGQRAIQLHEAVGDTRALARATMNMGVLAIRMGELASAEAYLRQAVEAQSQMGNQHGLMFATGNLARLLLNRGELDDARAQARKAARLAVEVGDRAYLSRFLNVRAELEAKAGDSKAARKALGRSQRLLRDDDGPITRAFVSLAAAWVALADRAWQQAADALDEADRLTQDQPPDGVIRSDLEQTREAVDRARLEPDSPGSTTD
ncbi:MAG: tetratricopeptide repeat protein, partial [Myxococcota bacterium]